MRREQDQPETEYNKAPLNAGSLGRLLKLALPYKNMLIGAGALVLVSTGISLSIPLISRQILDKVLISHDIGLLDKLALGMIALILLGAVIGYAQSLLVAIAGNRVIQDIRQKLFAHLQRLPVSYFDQNRSGDLASYLSNDVTQLQSSLTDDLVRLIGNLVTLVGGVALAVHIDWKLTLVVVLMMMAVSSFFFVFGKQLRTMNRATLDALSEAMGAITEALANIRLVKAFARERFEDSRVHDGLGKVFKLSMKASYIEGGFGTVGFSGFILVMMGVLWYGGRNVMNGSLSAGSLLGFFMTIMIISGPIATLAMQYARLQRAVGAADRLFQILDESPEAPDLADAVAFPKGLGSVEFRELAFSYKPDQPVLQGLNLLAPAGKTTALVGASGAGKTTLSSLLYRFYDPQAGEILIDGVPISRIKRQSLRENIGIVPQEPILFNGTIRDNIRYGKLDATDAEVERAAKIANVEEFIGGLTDGYDTKLGERGITLSGGQRQRVAIARAVLKDPKILVLDEATSALDTKSEMLVREALERLMRNRTTLVIAHRLTTIQNADQIAVMDAGKVVEIGTHAALLTDGGKYAELQGFALLGANEGDIAEETATKKEVLLVAF